MAVLRQTLRSAPRFNENTWREDSEAYRKQLRQDARRDAGGPDADPLIGEIIKFSVADGYAEYVVVGVRPQLELVHVNDLDGYTISAAHIRGLTVADARALRAQDAIYENIMDDHDRFVENVPVGGIVHYDNGFGAYVRMERVEGTERGKRFRPIALVGEWSDWDLPKRRPDGTINYGYHAEKVLFPNEPDTLMEPNVSCYFEAEPEKFRARGKGDPRTMEPLDLTVAEPSSEEKRYNDHVRLMGEVRAALGDDWPTDIEDARARLETARSILGQGLGA